MPYNTLSVTLIQSHIVWEDKAANLARYSALLTGISGPKEVVVLPEMFATGFSMEAHRLAEAMDGATVAWMRSAARQHRCILAGSVIIEEGGCCYNRLVWMQPDGTAHHYDKRHLFAYAGEDKVYTPGARRVIVSVKGWRVCLQVCYDLRFPVWSRQTTSTEEAPEYDVLLYVAAWPERRALPWKTLLPARAVENQCYVVGVNRVGEDGGGIHHSGDSGVWSPGGEVLYTAPAGEEAVHTVVLQRQALDETRSRFPFWKDGDRFVLL